MPSQSRQTPKTAFFCSVAGSQHGAAIVCVETNNPDRRGSSRSQRQEPRLGSQMDNNAVRADVNPHQTAHPQLAKAPVIKISSEHIGKVLDHGKSSQVAIKLLAIRSHHSDDDFALNVTHCATRHGVGRDAFQRAVKLMADVGIIARKQVGKQFAQEVLNSPSSPSFATIRVSTLDLPTAVVAFIVAARLSPKAARPADVAKRIGITSRTTIGRIVREAAATGEIACYGVGNRQILVGRPGLDNQLSKNQLSKNQLSKFQGTQSNKEGRQVDERKNTGDVIREVQYAPKGGDVRLLELSDWTGSDYFSSVSPMLLALTPKAGALSLAEWRRQMKWACEGHAPAHLLTRIAHRQALEITAYIATLRGWTRIEGEHAVSCAGWEFQVREVMLALASEIARAVAKGKTIKSLAFVAERMARFVEQGGDVTTAASIRANWWPTLGDDPGAPRQLNFDELADEQPDGKIRCKDIAPSVEALSRAWAFMQQRA